MTRIRLFPRAIRFARAITARYGRHPRWTRRPLVFLESSKVSVRWDATVIHPTMIRPVRNHTFTERIHPTTRHKPETRPRMASNLADGRGRRAETLAAAPAAASKAELTVLHRTTDLIVAGEGRFERRPTRSQSAVANERPRPIRLVPQIARAAPPMSGGGSNLGSHPSVRRVLVRELHLERAHSAQAARMEGGARTSALAGTPQPPAADVDVLQLTDRVIDAIDRRIVARRERLGKP